MFTWPASAGVKSPVESISPELQVHVTSSSSTVPELSLTVALKRSAPSAVTVVAELSMVMLAGAADTSGIVACKSNIANKMFANTPRFIDPPPIDSNDFNHSTHSDHSLAPGSRYHQIPVSSSAHSVPSSSTRWSTIQLVSS